jgi:hypothetical protein
MPPKWPVFQQSLRRRSAIANLSVCIRSVPKGIFYFDPDIVAAAPSFFEEWITCGIALCEDVNSPLSINHPRRVAWRRYFGSIGIQLKFKGAIYAKAGFMGVSEAEQDIP